MVLEYIKLYTLDLCNWLFVEWHVVKHIFFFCTDPVFWVKLLKFPQKMSSSTILQIRYILWWHFLGFHIWKETENKKLIKLILPQTAKTNSLPVFISEHAALLYLCNEFSLNFYDLCSLPYSTPSVHRPSICICRNYHWVSQVRLFWGTPTEILYACLPSIPSTMLVPCSPTSYASSHINRPVQMNNHVIFFFCVLLINVCWTHTIWSPVICIQSDLSNILCRIWRAHFLHFHHGKSTLSSSSTALVCSGTGLSATARTISIHWENASRDIKSSGSEYWRSRQKDNKNAMNKCVWKISVCVCVCVEK